MHMLIRRDIEIRTSAHWVEPCTAGVSTGLIPLRDALRQEHGTLCGGRGRVRDVWYAHLIHGGEEVGTCFVKKVWKGNILRSREAMLGFVFADRVKTRDVAVGFCVESLTLTRYKFWFIEESRYIPAGKTEA